MHMKQKKYDFNKAMTKEVGQKSRADAIKTGGKMMKGGMPCKVSHGADAKIVGHN